MGKFAKLQIPPSTLEPVVIEFGGWSPDLMNLYSPGAVEALNVIPNEGGYVPFKSITAVAGLTLPDVCKGATLLNNRFGDLKLYAATRETLNVRVGSTFTNLWTSPDTLTDYDYWFFVQFGPSVVALHPQVTPLVSQTDGNDPFTTLEGNPPKAYCGARVGDFLVLGNLDDEPDAGSARQPQRIRWNGFFRIDAPWVSDPETQADYNDMPSEGGAVVGITGREFGTIFQEHCISRMTYVGLPAVFDIETVEENRGAFCTGGIVDKGTEVYFIAEDGFFVWNGTNATPIANDKVNRYFFSRLNYNERRRIVGVHDPDNSCIRWAFPLTGSTQLGEQLIYSYKDGRWSHAITIVEYLLNSHILPDSLDDMHGDLDTGYPISFDDPSFQGGKAVLAAFNSAHTYGIMNGAALAATLDTAETDGPGGTRMFAASARPIVDISAAVLTVQVAIRDQIIGGNITYIPAVAQEITGECPVLAEGRYMSFRTNIPAGATWSHAVGMQVWRKTTGRV